MDSVKKAVRDFKQRIRAAFPGKTITISNVSHTADGMEANVSVGDAHHKAVISAKKGLIITTA